MPSWHVAEGPGLLRGRLVNRGAWDGRYATEDRWHVTYLCTSAGSIHKATLYFHVLTGDLGGYCLGIRTKTLAMTGMDEEWVSDITYHVYPEEYPNITSTLRAAREKAELYAACWLPGKVDDAA